LIGFYWRRCLGCIGADGSWGAEAAEHGEGLFGWLYGDFVSSNKSPSLICLEVVETDRVADLGGLHTRPESF
jgi:hypothetical protein